MKADSENCHMSFWVSKVADAFKSCRDTQRQNKYFIFFEKVRIRDRTVIFI